MCLLQVDLLYVTFDPETAKISFAYCDATFSGHYVATIKVATSLVWFYISFKVFVLHFLFIPDFITRFYCCLSFVA